MRQKRRVGVLPFIFGVALLCGGGFAASRFVMHGRAPISDVNPPPEMPGSSLVRYIPAVEKIIADKTSDPFAARFQGVRIADACQGCTGSGAGSMIMCGEFITKNLTGAYTGWHRFSVLVRAYNTGPVLSDFQEDTASDFEPASFEDCQKRGGTDGK